MKKDLMNLKDFVSQTLTHIIDGVKDAQASTGDELVSPPYKDADKADINVGRIFSKDLLKIEYIEFDIAVAATKGTKTKGGLGIFVTGLGAGSMGESQKENQSVNRIKFKIPIAIPQKS
jgi:hypothetical protein